MNMKMKMICNYAVKFAFADKGQTAKQAFIDLILQKSQNENKANSPIDFCNGEVYNESVAFSDIRALNKEVSL